MGGYAVNLKEAHLLPNIVFGACIEEQVDAIAQCMDIKNAKETCEHENFCSINRTTKLCSYMERPVTLGQVTKCLKRMKTMMAESKFLYEGCQYKCSERMSQEAFKIRWPSFKTERCIKVFAPWNKL